MERVKRVSLLGPVSECPSRCWSNRSRAEGNKGIATSKLLPHLASAMESLAGDTKLLVRWRSHSPQVPADTLADGTDARKAPAQAPSPRTAADSSGLSARRRSRLKSHAGDPPGAAQAAAVQPATRRHSTS